MAKRILLGFIRANMTGGNAPGIAAEAIVSVKPVPKVGPETPATTRERTRPSGAKASSPTAGSQAGVARHSEGYPTIGWWESDAYPTLHAE